MLVTFFLLLLVLSFVRLYFQAESLGFQNLGHRPKF